MKQVDQEKIQRVLKNLDQNLKEEGLKDKEYLVLVANMLYAFGIAGLKMFTQYKGLNFNDAVQIEAFYIKDSNNVYLASLMQSHVLLKWSDSLG